MEVILTILGLFFFIWLLSGNNTSQNSDTSKKKKEEEIREQYKARQIESEKQRIMELQKKKEYDDYCAQIKLQKELELREKQAKNRELRDKDIKRRGYDR